MLRAQLRDAIPKMGILTLLAAGVVVDDPPALGKLAENQREQPVRLLAIRESEQELSADKPSFRPQHLDLKIGEFQLAHFSVGRLILLAIALPCRLPPVGLRRAGKECKRR